MVAVDVDVTHRMDEISGLQSAYLGNHHSQESIGRDIERNSQEDICAALVQLTTQLSVDDVKLEHRMARRQGHLVHFGRVPGAHDEPA